MEKAERARQAALKKARAEAKAREENTRPSQTEGTRTGSAPPPSDFWQYLNDPEVLQAFKVNMRAVLHYFSNIK